jgi:hypothetical protein
MNSWPKHQTFAVERLALVAEFARIRVGRNPNSGEFGYSNSTAQGWVFAASSLSIAL